MSMAKIKLFSVTSVKFGSILNVTNLIIQITCIFKTVMNPGITQIIAAQFFLSTPYQTTKTSCFVVQTLITTSHRGDKWCLSCITVFFHINACSLNKKFDDLQDLLSCIKKFDVIAISETRITKQVSLSNNLNLNNYSFEFTPTETSAGISLL